MNDRYTHGHHESVLRSHTWRTVENSAAFVIPHLRADLQVLDVGCGPGTLSADIAERVQPGHVRAVDLSSEVLAAAAARYGDTHPNLTFAVDDVYALSSPDEHFDLVFAHQVLQHLSSPVAALGEMRRVLKPGGLVALREADFGAFTWFPASPALDHWLAVYFEVTRANHAQAMGGRYLKAWAHAAGFDDVEVSSSNWTFSTSPQRHWWGGLWADRVVHSDFASQAVNGGFATREELAAMAQGFHEWASSPDGVFVVPNVEVLARRA